MATSPAPTTIARPLFGGYILVAVTLAWLAGIALRAVGPLVAVPPLVWLLVGLLVLAAALALARWIISHCACWAACGADSHYFVLCAGVRRSAGGLG